MAPYSIWMKVQNHKEMRWVTDKIMLNLIPGVLQIVVLLSGPVDANCNPGNFEEEIRQYEESDSAHPPTLRSVVFVGSSSIRMWETLEEDFPGLPVINRGFGGCEMEDVVWYANRIVLPYQPKTVIVYAGDNDLANGKSVEKVLLDCKALVKRIRDSDPTTRIGFILIKPSPSRWHLESEIRDLNEKIQEYCNSDEGLFYVDVFTPMLDTDQLPRNELFLEDQLHMNRDGYRLWRDAVRPFLMRVDQPHPEAR